MRLITALFLCFITAFCLSGASSASNSPLAPDNELASFHFADPNLTAELIVAEPDVVSPVCVAWDADGRVLVVEMTDYPTGPTGGRVRLLEDRDGDGRFERVTVFADQLAFPTSVLPWRDGVLVTAAPDIWFLKDTDGDGQADERRVLFTGFGQGNQQLRVNGLTWGLDNWVYGANGRSDGEVRWVAQAFKPALQNTVSIRRRDFRFRPDTGEFEAIAGQSQFGTTFDDWGNRFLSWNTMPFRHVVIETRYLDRVPQLAAAESSQNLQPPGDDGRIFPLTAPPQLFNNESQTHFNASAGTTVYRGDALGDKYKGNVFVGEPLRNLVHRRVLVPKGVTFEAHRGEEGKEFLASTDPWFHPVYFTTGPDGALYVVDFYREFVEHPGYVPEEMRNKVDWRIGAEHGRIWRIRPKNWKSKTIKPNLSPAKSSELVKHLDNANAWWRITAQRLLVERQDKSVVSALDRIARKSSSPVGRLHALCTLDGLSKLSLKRLLSALGDPDARVRENAVRLAEPLLRSKVVTPASNEVFNKLIKSLTALTEDADPGVRRQLALACGEIPYRELSILSRLTETGIEDRWQSLAILSALGSRPWDFWRGLSNTHPDWLREPTEAEAEFLDTLASIVSGRIEPHDSMGLFSWLVMNRDKPFGRLTLFCRLADVAKSNSVLRQVLDSALAPAAPPNVSAGDLPDQAQAIAAAPDSPPPLKLAAIRALGKLKSPGGHRLLGDLLLPQATANVQAASVRALAELNDSESASTVFAKWTAYSKSVRRQLIGSTTRSSALAAALLDALEKGAIQLTEVDPSTRQALEKSSNTELKERAQRLFRSSVSADREEVIGQFKPAAAMAGDRPKGAAIFARACLQCHAMQGRGNAVGPNLYSVASQPKETLLVNILDPGRQVTPDFVSYTVTTTDGESLTGLITAESGSGVTMRRPNVPDLTIQRSQIKELRADGKSLMPDGLEQGLTQQDVADLLEFIRQPDDKLLPEDK